jgi:hypothetical protein
MAEHQGLGGLMAIGKSHAKIYVETAADILTRRSRRRRAPAARAGDAYRGSIPRDPLDRAAGKAGG